MSDLDHTRPEGRISALPAVNDGRSGPLAEISVKGNKVANRSTGMGKYGKIPESVNDVSTIHPKISRNYLEGRHDRYSGVFELEG
jgi:hypothetical protein